MTEAVTVADTEDIFRDLDILETRIRNLEALTASQQVDMRKLRAENDELVVTLRKVRRGYLR